MVKFKPNSMKNLSLLFLLLFIGCATKQNRKNDLEKLNLKGNVKSFTHRNFYAGEKFGEVVKKDEKLFERSYKEFSKKGNELKRIVYDHNGKAVYEYTFKRDKYGNIIDQNFYDSEGNLKYNFTFKYDAKGDIIERNTYENLDGELKKARVYKNESNENKMEATEYDLEGNFMSKYDAKGNLIERDYPSPIDFKFKFKYDINGNKVEESVYYLDNEQGREGDLESKSKYKYDAKGNKIEYVRFDSKGNLESKEAHKYNAKGDVIETSEYGDENILKEVFTYKYKYDQEGNWVERIKLDKKDEPSEITEREITYY